MTDWSVLQDDLADLLRALDISDHARPVSPHQVMIDEVIPAAKTLKAERDRLSTLLSSFTHVFFKHPDRDWCVARDLNGEWCGEYAPAAVHQTPTTVRARIAREIEVTG